MIEIKKPYLIFLGSAKHKVEAKLATSIIDFKAEFVTGYNKLPDSPISFEGFENLSLIEGKEKGAKTLVIGVVNFGGYISKEWIPTILEAISLGFDIANGMHAKLEDIAEIKEAAEKYGVMLHNVRHYDGKLQAGTGAKRSGKRILTVGSDCNMGKKYTAISLANQLNKEHIKATFRATGQSGIMVAGSGIAIDAVPADFIAGSVENLSPNNEKDHFDIIEGQGSLFHPAYAGVSLGLIHGSQPDYLVFCLEPTRVKMRHTEYTVPDLEEVIKVNLQMARLTNSNVKPLAISINSSLMEKGTIDDYKKSLEEKFNLPVEDSIRDGLSKTVEFLKKCENLL